MLRFLLYFILISGCNAGATEPRPEVVTPKVATARPYDPKGQIILTKHARCRMDCRHITLNEIQQILDEGTINYDKSNPGGRPDPKWAVEGFTSEKQHLRIIVAVDGKKLIIVTCIELGVEWRCDCN